MQAQCFKDLYPSGIQLRGDVLITETPHSVSFLHKKEITIRTTNPQELSFLKNLRIGLDYSELTHQLTSPRVLKFLSLLNEHHCLKPYVPRHKINEPLGRQLDWLSHFSSEPSARQNSFSSSTILILGCGGTGSIIAEHLVRSGANNLAIVDGGIVDAPDMNRQFLYYPHDFGRLKTEVLEERLIHFNPALKIVKYSSFIQSREQLAKILGTTKPDLMINCADTPIGLIHTWVSEACLETDVPVLFGGVGLDKGTLGPLLVSSDSKKQYAARTHRAHSLLKDNGNILKASVSFTNSIVSAWIAFEAFKFLSGLSSGSEVENPLTINLISPTRSAYG